MVNDEFPKTPPYGFEKVDADVHQSEAASIEIDEPINQSIFWQIFGELSSPQSLTIYRRLLVSSWSMIRKKPAPHLDSGVGTDFPKRSCSKG